jgi:hypothetical protein
LAARKRSVANGNRTPSIRKSCSTLSVTTPDDAGSQQKWRERWTRTRGLLPDKQHFNDEVPSPKIPLLPVSAHAQRTPEKPRAFRLISAFHYEVEVL